MKAQVFVITSILGIITAHAFAAIVPERTDVANKIAVESALKKEYKLEYFAKANWFNVWLSCLGCGMKLASITSQEAQHTIVKLINEYGMANDNVWIAGNDIATEGRFKWFTSGEIFQYTNWSPNEPNNNGSEHCVEIRGGQHIQKWNDAHCTTLNFFLCEKSLECS